MSRALHPCAAGALALALALPALAASSGDATLKDLQKRQVEVRKDAPSDVNAGKAMDNYRRFLELQKTDPALRAEAMRRLGDLSLESGELDRLATEVTRVDLGGAEAIRLYTLLLKAYPGLSAQRPGALPAGARLRNHGPARQGAGHAGRHRRALSRRRAKSPKCISAAANCCSRPCATRTPKPPTPK